MALVKDQRPRDHSQDDGAFAHGQHLSAPGMYEFMEHDKSSGNINIISRSSSLSSPSSTNSSGALNIYSAMNSQQQEGQSLISFNPGFSTDNYFMHADNGSFLSFEQDDFSSVSDQNQVNQWRSISKVHVLENFNAIQNASGSSTLKANLNHGDHESYSWLNSEATLSADCIEQELTTEQPGFHKRTHTGESSQALKKQCTSASKKPKPKSLSTAQSISKDPQSIAAKNRRERISERLKILQDLVPNGSKVDLVTMLEKAISYVKFLQLQMKVLASDELWPMQGGKAPELSQVKDAIDAIIASQIDTNSS